MNNSEEVLGPIDIVVIGFPPGAPMRGDAVPIFLDLVDRGIIRVFDAMLVKKEDDGTVSGFDLSDVDEEQAGDLTVFSGASTGLLGNDDVETVAAELEPGAAAALSVCDADQLPRMRAFSAASSSSVRMPCSVSSASCLSWAMRSLSGGAAAGALGAA